MKLNIFLRIYLAQIVKELLLLISTETLKVECAFLCLFQLLINDWVWILILFLNSLIRTSGVTFNNFYIDLIWDLILLLIYYVLGHLSHCILRAVSLQIAFRIFWHDIGTRIATWIISIVYVIYLWVYQLSVCLLI